MKVGVIGGTGTAGSYAVEALRADGHSVSVICRATGVDVFSGEGLPSALDGVDVVVDATNTPSLRRGAATRFFETAARRLQAAAQTQRVEHIVLLSIVGLERVRGYGYYDAKLAQERALTSGTVPVTVLRATQFFEFPGQMLARLRLGPVALVPRMQSQPVAARTVGAHLARLATERPGGTVELAGPEVRDIADLAQRLVAARGVRLRTLAVTAPGRAARDTRGGALLATARTIIDGPSFDNWLTSPDAQHVALGRTRRDDRARTRVAPPTKG